jgi:hypothetical protein
MEKIRERIAKNPKPLYVGILLVVGAVLLISAPINNPPIAPSVPYVRSANSAALEAEGAVRVRFTPTEFVINNSTPYTAQRCRVRGNEDYRTDRRDIELPPGETRIPFHTLYSSDARRLDIEGGRVRIVRIDCQNYSSEWRAR